MARPTSYSPEAAVALCEAVAEHGSLTAALRADKTLPPERTIYRWLATNEEFRQAYTRAREIGDEPVIEEMRRIAFDEELPSDQKRVRIDTLKWEIARRSPKKWGEKLSHEHAGPNGDPIRYTVVTGVPEPGDG